MNKRNSDKTSQSVKCKSLEEQVGEYLLQSKKLRFENEQVLIQLERENALVAELEVKLKEQAMEFATQSEAQLTEFEAETSSLKSRLAEKCATELVLQERLECYFVKHKTTERELRKLKRRIESISRNTSQENSVVPQIAASQAFRATFLQRAKNWLKRQFKRKLSQRTNEAIVAQQAQSIRSSPLFDQKYYLANNSDVAAKGVDPAEHYLLYGGFEGRNPSPHFDSAWYLNNYPDVAQESVNPLLHFIKFGQHEGRLAKPFKKDQ